MYDAIMKYGLFGEVIDLPRHLKSLFVLLKPNIDASINRHVANVGNGKKGGAPVGNQNASKQKQPKKQPEEQPDINHDNDTANNKATDTANNTDMDIEEENVRGGGVIFAPKKESGIPINDAIDQGIITLDEAVTLRIQGKQYV